MTLKLGRCGTDVTLRDPSTWEANGDRASISGFLSAATQADVNVLREQLLGYNANPDEEIVPVTWTVDSRVDGFYRVLGVQVSDDPGWRSALTLPYRVELERVPGFASPVLESVLLGALRTNGHSITTSRQAWHAVPAAATGYDSSLNVPMTLTLTRVSADGNMTYRSFTVGGGTTFEDSKPRYYIAPASYYIGACKVEVGTTLRTVAGRQILNLPTDWRLSNGLVRVTPVAGSQNIDVSHYDGTQWETAKRYKIEPSARITAAPHGIAVLRNSPEEAIIRLSYIDVVVADHELTHNVDLMVRRGSRTVYVTMTTGSDAATPKGLARATNEAATALTGGLRATSADASGNRYFLAMAQAFASDLTIGKLTADPSAITVEMAIGSNIGAVATVGETEQDQIYQFMTALSERLTTVGR